MRRALLLLLSSVWLVAPELVLSDTSTVPIRSATIASASPAAKGKMRRTQAGTGSPMIAAGQLHTLLVKPDGTVWTWGFNDNGQLGDCLTHRNVCRFVT